MKIATLKRLLKKIASFYFRMGLKNKKFSIISNNCWGGGVYDKYGLRYLSPTIGLWIPPDDYIIMLRDLRTYLSEDLVQISWQESHIKNILLEKHNLSGLQLDSLVIGRLKDIDIVFLHYSSFVEAKEKWTKRCKRVNFDNLLVKFNDQNGCTVENVRDYLRLQYRYKLFFTAKAEWCTNNECILFKQYLKDGYVKSDMFYGNNPIDMTKYLNKMK